MQPLISIRPSLLLLPVLTLLASCQKNEVEAPITELTLRSEVDLTVPPGAPAGSLDLSTTYDAQAAVGQLLQQNGFTMDQLKDVRIEDARAVLIDPTNTRFDAVESVLLDFAQPAGTPLNFAHLDPVPDNLGILDLSVEHTDLTSYFQSGPQTVSARIQSSAPVSSGNTRIRFALTFRVKAGA